MTYPRAPLSAAEELEITPPKFSRTSRVCVTQSALASKRVVVRYETMPMDNRTTSARLNPTPIILRGFIFALSGRRPAVLCYGLELPTHSSLECASVESERAIFYLRTKFRKTSAQVILFGERIRSQNFGAHGPISYHPTMAQDMGDRIHTEVKDIILALVFLTRPLQPPQISWFPLRSRFPVWVFTDRRFTLQGANTFRGFLYILQGSETILLVEDEESLRTLTRILLTQTGYTVLEANSGAQALDIAQRHEGPRLYGTRHPQSWSSGSRHSPPAKALHSGNPDAQGARGSRRR